MSGHSENELVAWLKEDSRMFDWGMIAVMDRAKANRLLTQEYIRHFAEDSYLPPQTGEVNTDSSWKNTITNAVLDVPRLSFENSNLQNSMARLRMAMVSGNRVRLENSGGWQIRRIDQYGPQQRPELRMDLKLADVPGGVKDGGALYLDLKDCSDFSFDFAGSENEQRDMGLFFKKQFDELEESKRTYGLGKIKAGSNEAMRPEKFLLRTQPRDPNAKDGEGALISFIRLEGDLDGSIPTSSETFKYLIPNDAGKDYSAAVAITSGRLAISQMLQALRETIPGATFDMTYQQIGSKRVLTGARMTGGRLDVEGGRVDISQCSEMWGELTGEFEIYDFYCDFADKLEISIDSKDSKSIEFTVNLLGDIDGQMLSLESTKGDINKFIETFSLEDFFFGRKSDYYECQIKGSYELSDEDGGQLKWTSFDFEVVREPQFYKMPSDQRALASGPWELVEKLIIGFFQAILGAVVKSIFSEFDEAQEQISLRGYIEKALKDNFPLLAPTQALIKETLDYNFNNSIVADHTHLPLDAVAFGKVNPSLTSFVVDDLEPVLVAGSTKQFSTIPARDDVQWSVEPEGCGYVDEKTGEYTAPAVEDFDGPFIRARVIAKSKDAESSALVTVVDQGLLLNPLVVTTWTEEEVDLQAGGLDPSTVFEWRFENDEPHGAFKTPGAASANMTYVAGPTKTKSKAFYIDEVSVHDKKTGNKRRSVIIIKDRGPSLDIKFTVDAGHRAVTLEAFEYGDDVTAETTWHLEYGPGRIEENRYIADPAASESFALLTATFVDSRRTYEGFVVLPLPLSNNTRALAALCKGAC
ncbi:hypothetical protein [Pseudomonas guariconensis]|uniref:hypothetical protein n=1 Tax=Pseudomonas guariconensis TaxID=1288410 RepID=UPI0018ABC194|nr:hypothetical protein [Pseudomonas guariconensis]MBF8743051.1 hypothetical protein [Pseudomonas guariconensis]MBF8753043.1 hypothetical protein [Pseudomonas guariconensis]